MRHALAVALAGLALAGCMGDDDGGADPGTSVETIALPDGSTTTETVTTEGPNATAPPKSAFARQADAICARYNDEVEDIAAPSDPAQLAPALRAANAIAKRELAELRRLDPPPGREATTANFIAALERVVAAIDRFAAATARNDGTGVQQALSDADVESDEARRLAEKLGLEECGRAGATAAATG